jgi:hypothetical protein
MGGPEEVEGLPEAVRRGNRSRPKPGPSEGIEKAKKEALSA